MTKIRENMTDDEKKLLSVLNSLHNLTALGYLVTTGLPDITESGKAAAEELDRNGFIVSGEDTISICDYLVSEGATIGMPHALP
jgi:hypothetical protein